MFERFQCAPHTREIPYPLPTTAGDDQKMEAEKIERNSNRITNYKLGTNSNKLTLTNAACHNFQGPKGVDNRDTYLRCDNIIYK